MSSKNVNVILDLGTFGNSKACHVLVEMMNENLISEYQKHKVLSFLNDATTQFKWISTINYYPVMERTLTLMYHDLIKRANEYDYPLKFKSFMKNVISYMYKKTLTNNK